MSFPTIVSPSCLWHTENMEYGNFHRLYQELLMSPLERRLRTHCMRRSDKLLRDNLSCREDLDRLTSGYDDPQSPVPVKESLPESISHETLKPYNITLVDGKTPESRKRTSEASWKILVERVRNPEVQWHLSHDRIRNRTPEHVRIRTPELISYREPPTATGNGRMRSVQSNWDGAWEHTGNDANGFNACGCSKPAQKKENCIFVDSITQTDPQTDFQEAKVAAKRLNTIGIPYLESRRYPENRRYAFYKYYGFGGCGAKTNWPHRFLTSSWRRTQRQKLLKA